MASNSFTFGGTPVPTSTTHTGNGTAGPFSISIAYGIEQDIDVFVAGVLKTRTTHYTFTSATQITFTSGNEPANGATILFQRNTYVGAATHIFSDASVLTATELNENNKQILHGVQELVDDYVRRDGTQSIRANLVFEGPVDDSNETTLAIENPTADRTITLPDRSGTVITSGDTGTVTSTMINDGTIVNVDISGSAAISGSKLQPASTSSPGSMSASDKLKLNGIETGATGDQTAAEIRTLVESASDSNVFTDADHTKLNAIEAGATGDQTNAEIRAAVEAASDSNVFTDADHSKLNGIEAGATGDQTNAEIRAAVEAASDSNVFTDADHTKLNNAATLTDSQTLTNKTLTSPVINGVSGTAIVTSGTSTSDTQVYSAKRVGELFYGKDTLEEIQSGETWSAADTKIATTAAIDARIIDFVDDVGGFNAIANETSFPSTNPQGSAGQVAILSIATVSTTLTPSSNTITIANGAGTGNTVTINNVTPSSVPQGFGLIVESTSTLHTYNFHRLVPKATEVSTVASISGNVTTVAGISSNVTTVANNDSNVTAVAGKATEIGRLGTTDAVADMALLGTTDAVADMNTLGTSSNVTNMNTLAGISSNITTVAGVSSDVSTVAGISSNVTSVANNSSNINSAVSNASNINAAVSNASNINSAVSNESNITTVAGSISNVNTTAGSIANVNSVASNIANVDNFAEKYQIAANNPSTDGGGNALAAGDLYFNTSANELKVYNGSSWQGGVTATGSFAVVTGNTFTGDNKYNDGVKLLVGTGSDLEIFHHSTDGSFINDAGTSTLKLQLGGSTKLEIQSGGIGVTGSIAVSGNVDGRDLATDGAKLDGIAASSTANPNAIDNVVEDTSPQLGGDLDVQTSKVTTSTSNGNVKIEPNGTGVVEIRGASGNDGKLQLNCSAQSHGIKLASPAHSAGQSYTFIFPDNQIAADKYLKVKSITGSGATATGQLEYASLDANDLGEGTIPSGRFGTDTIATGSLAAGALPTDVTITDANVVSNASITGTKVSPNFGSQNIATTGTLASGLITSTGSNGNITTNQNGHLFLQNTNNSSTNFWGISPRDNGVLDIGYGTKSSGLIAGDVLTLSTSGLDVTGDLTIDTNTLHVDSSNNRIGIGTDSPSVLLDLESSSPTIKFTDSDASGTPESEISGAGGDLVLSADKDDEKSNTQILLKTDGSTRLTIAENTTTVANNLDCSSGVDITGNLTVTGTVDGVDIATRNTLFGGLTSSSGVLSNGVTATTQSAGDNSTKVATTAYTDTAIANLVDSSPGALNTLNELAAAINDDASFSTTITNSIATKMSLSGGTFTGDIVVRNITPPSGVTNIDIGSSSDTFRNGYFTTLYGNGSNVTNVNASLLDNIDSSSFLRSDTSTTFNASGNDFNFNSDGSRTLINYNYNNSTIWRLVQNNSGANLDFERVSGSGEFKVKGQRVLTTADEGSGNGIDADTVDGIQAANFLRSDQNDSTSGELTASFLFAGSSIVSSGAKFQANGFIRTGPIGLHRGNTSSNPSTTNEWLHNDGGVLYWGSAATTSDAKVWTSANDGSGSGLDADTVDGIHGTNFLRSDYGSGGDTANADITFAGGAGAATIAGNSDIRLTNGDWTGDHSCKLQHHSNIFYIQGGTSGHQLRTSSGGHGFSVDSSGNCTALGNVTAYSDARLKTNVNTINDALGICGKLRGVSFDWIESGKHSIGLIAQEVEEVIPELVLTNRDLNPNTGEEKEVKSVDYGKIVGVLVNAINELKAEVDELKGAK